MKYRKKPDDFIVEEVANHKILKDGPYKLYIVEKVGIETFELFNLFSRIHNVPRSEIGFAGIKDAFAKTRQYISIPKKYELKNLETAKVNFLGYIANPLKLGDLIANKFVITVRDIREDELNFINENAKSVSNGLPNYFDSQRFGSVVDKKFIGRFLVKKDYEQAVKQYLTSYADSDTNERDADKEAIFKSWGKFNVKIHNFEFKNIIQAYRDTNKWIVAYKHIQPSLRQLFVSSYQSYIWNECVKVLMKENVPEKELYYVPYAVNELIFSKNKIENLPETFQTISHKIEPEDYEKEILEKVLSNEEVEIREFNIRQTGNFFKSNERNVMMYPKGFEMDKPVQEGRKYNVTVRFTLPKGSYATMVLKKIFEQ